MARIVIVDDEAIVGAVLEMMAGRDGHTVLFSTGKVAEALAKARALSLVKSPDIAIIDGDIEGPNDGKRVAAEFRERWPNIIIISFSATRRDWGDLNLIKPEELKTLWSHLKKDS